MITKKNISSVFLVFLGSHLIIWTLVPTFSNVNLPLDTIEALAWGSNLDWSFDKHPPLSALAVEIFYQIFGNQDWAFYLLSQIFILITFLVIYKFAEEFLKDKILALFSVILLESIFFYNFTSPEFNVNICQLPFWALSIFYTWRCIKFDNFKDYIYLGVFIGLGILSKYLFLYLVIGIKLLFIYLISKKKIKFKNCLITGPTTLLILFPHIIWLFDNNFATIFYGVKRTGGLGDFMDHLLLPSIFLIKQIGILIPFFLIFYFLLKKFKFKINLDQRFIFLLFTFLIPILFIFLTSIILGIKIRTMWMTPFYLLTGVFMIYIFQKNILKKNFKKFTTIFLFIFIISPTTYLIVSLKNDFKRTDYPGKEIARLVQNKWDSNFRNDINIIVGDEWYAGNLSYHLGSRPKWMNSLKNEASNVKLNGGVIYTGNPEILKKVCPGVFGTIKPVGYCMIGQK